VTRPGATPSIVVSAGQAEWSGTSTAEEKCQLTAAPTTTRTTAIAATARRTPRRWRRSHEGVCLSAPLTGDRLPAPVGRLGGGG
jgi:hypothetical protein